MLLHRRQLSARCPALGQKRASTAGSARRLAAMPKHAVRASMPLAALEKQRHHAAGAAFLSALLVLTASPLSAGAVARPSGRTLLQLEGAARVVDGDTLYVRGEKIRLVGVDAPEKAQSCKDAQGRDYSCGQDSLRALTAHIGSSPVRCDVRSRDQYGRAVSTCSILAAGAPPEDVGTWLVTNGFAVAYKQYSKQYIPLEQQAEAQHIGIWQGSFQYPADWRRAQRAAGAGGSSGLAKEDAPAAVRPPAVAAAASPPAPSAMSGASASTSASGAKTGAGGCTIKGNINSKGAKLYHLPGDPAYAATQIQENKGERYFCSEQQAQAAGWEHAVGGGRPNKAAALSSTPLALLALSVAAVAAAMCAVR